VDDHDVAELPQGAALLQDVDHGRGLATDLRVDLGVVTDSSLELSGCPDHH
jgi:hypothetical protein